MAPWHYTVLSIGTLRWLYTGNWQSGLWWAAVATLIFMGLFLVKDLWEKKRRHRR